MLSTLRSDLPFYDPCETGIHLCGIDEGADAPLTLGNISMASHDDAKRTFDLAREEFECKGDDPQEIVVDLMHGGDIVEDFWTSRQMVERLLRAQWAAMPPGAQVERP